MIADILLWLEDNLLIAGGIVLAVFVIGLIVISRRRNGSSAIISAPTAFARNDSKEATASLEDPVQPAGIFSAVNQLEKATYNPARNHEQARHLIQSIQGDPPRRRFSTLYMAGLFVVAIAMLILPLLYMAIVAAVGYGLYAYATQNTDIFQRTGSVRVNVFLYMTPLIVGGVVLLFLLKPLFARRGKQMAPIVLNEKDEPVLFAFVQELCLTLKAPIPKAIQVVSNANAYASFRHSFWSLFRSGDMVLTIGLPLAMGMNLRSFAGVLAHEFGHFTQGTAMRLMAIIHFVNTWFARVVYENDSWDEGMDHMIQSSPWFLQFIFLIAKLATRIGRSILWLLMQLGHAISSFLSRQQEFDADRYEGYISGSSDFVHSTQQIISLDIATQAAYRDLGYGLEKMVLPDDFVALCLHIRGKIPPVTMAGMTNQIFNTPARMLDTHPSCVERVKAIERLNLPGIFHPPEVSARVLFRNMEDLCQESTLRLYQQALGRLVDKRIMAPLPVFLEKIEILKNKRINSW